MTKRFTDDGAEAIVDQSFTDNLTKKTYYVDYFDEIVDLLNELDEKYVDEFSLRETLQQELQRVEEENEKLHHAIVETEKMVQSTYDELTKLRCIKKNLGRIKTQWDWIMEAIQYD